MNDIFEMQLKENSSEELLTGFTADFPYVNSRALLNRYDVFWHWHKAVELFFVESGTLEYDTPQGRTVFLPGSGGFVNTGVLHTSRPQKESYHTIQLLHIFDAALLFGQTESLIYQKYFSPILTSPQTELISLHPDDPSHRDTLKKLKRSFEISQFDFGYEIRLREALSGIWLDLLKLLPANTKQGNKSSEKIKQMMVYIHEHFHENIKIADIAAAGYVSERECFRTFQHFLHITPTEYVRNYRLQVACRLLADGSDTITQISHTCGFGSSSFFGKIFLANMGMTPTAYRQRWRDTTK